MEPPAACTLGVRRLLGLLEGRQPCSEAPPVGPNSSSPGGGRKSTPHGLPAPKRPHPRDGLSDTLSSDGIQRTAKRDPDASNKEVICRRGRTIKHEWARPLQAARATGRLSTRAKCLIPKFEVVLSLCLTDQSNARVSVRRIFSAWAHGADQTTSQSLSTSSFGEISAKVTSRGSSSKTLVGLKVA